MAGYPPKYWAGPEDADRAIDLLRAVGFWHLSGSDGCLCGSIKIFAFEIAVSCRKSQQSITVSSRHIDVTRDDLEKVADEVLRQYRERSEPEPKIILDDEVKSAFS